MASATVASNVIVLEALNQHNFKDWSSRLETYLLSKDLWDIVKAEPPEAENGEAEYKAWRTKNAEALHAIKLSCGTEIFSFIRETSTAKKAWEILEQQFKPYTALVFEKKERQRSLHTANNAGQTREVRKKLVLAEASEEEDLEIKDNDGYTVLHKAVIKGNVDIVKQLVPLMKPEGLGIKSNDGETALHTATRLGKVNIVKQLVPWMRPEDLAIRNNNDGQTALHIAAQSAQVDIVKELVLLMREEDLEIKDDIGYTALGGTLYVPQSEEDLLQIARYMVEKNKKILSMDLPSHNHIPVVKACVWGKWKMCRYLYSVTPHEALSPDNGNQGAQLISKCIRLGKGLDMALDLLQRYPKLAIVNSRFGSPMLELAQMRYAFLSGKKLTFLQNWIYKSIHPKPVDFNAAEIAINISKSEDDQGNQRNPICSVMSLNRRFVKRLGINHIYKMKSAHIRVKDFLNCMAELTRDTSTFTLAEQNIVTSSIFKAVEKGHVEFVIHLSKANPTLVDALDEKDRNIFQYAIECRQERIYNLIYGLQKEKRNKIGLSVAKINNSMLHCAANLSPLTRIQGASLQMQRELQWFKEVESIVPVEMHEYLNFSDGLTARELFTKNHKKLMEEAEISMKGTATSCTTVGALIVTIMFAVAFTVPGGTNDITSLPTFMHKKLFKVFIVSDIISLASSSTSVITCLGVLTSRYAEDDFLESLPKKMMLGLSTLFISIATMMIAFFCALTIMLDGAAWIIIPSIMFASVPIISFVWLLFPLLVDICKSTYGAGVFDRNVKPYLDIKP